MHRLRHAIFLLTLLALASSTSARTFYVAPNGNDRAGGTDAAPWATVPFAYTRMTSGDTLILKDGTYSRQDILAVNARQVYPPTGTAAAPTTLRAANFGKVIIDGGTPGPGQPPTMSPIEVAGPPPRPVEHLVIDGLIFRNQNNGATIYGVKNIRFLRCGFEGAAPGNNATFSAHRCSNILLEDCFTWGTGRYKFVSYHSDRVIFRRCLARIDRLDAGGEPMAGFSIYASDQVRLQNCFVVDGDRPDLWWNVGEYSGAFSFPSTDGLTSNITVEGCGIFNFAGHAFTVSKNVSNLTIRDFAVANAQATVYARDPYTLERYTFARLTGKTPPPLLGDASPTALNYQGGGTHPGNPTIKDGLIAARPEALNPPMKFFLDDPRGASIKKRLGKSGALWGEQGFDQPQPEELWPWPNEAIIAEHMRKWEWTDGRSTISGNRGFAKEGGKGLTDYLWTALGVENPYAPKPAPPQ